MKRAHAGAALIAAACLLAPSAALADGYPAHDGFVTDKTGLLPPEVRASLDAKLTQYARQTSIEIAVLIVPSLDGAEPNDYAQGVWEEWRVGKKGEDNGVMLLVVPPPEKLAWIATGYGIQGWLTDLESKHIIEEVMRPLNLQERRPEAVVAGVDAIIAKLGDTPWVERAKTGPPQAQGDAPLSDGAKAAIVIGIILLLILLQIMGVPVLDILFVILSAFGRGGSGGSSGGGSSGGFGGGGSGGSGGGGRSG